VGLEGRAQLERAVKPLSSSRASPLSQVTELRGQSFTTRHMPNRMRCLAGPYRWQASSHPDLCSRQYAVVNFSRTP